MNKRKNSSIINLRKFHNWIKRTQIMEAVDMLRSRGFKEIKILDLATGKGGDLNKWSSAKVDEVYGVDIDKESLFGKNGALHRFNNFKKINKNNKNIKVPFIRFKQVNLLDDNALDQVQELVKEKKFELITCQFAIHYFFESQDTINNFFNIVNKFIQPNGIFLGTTLDGDRVNKMFNNGDEIKKKLLYLKMKYDLEQSVTPFGNKYLIRIGESGEDHYFKDTMSEEYLVSVDEFKRQSDKLNFVYVGTIPFEKWYVKYQQHVDKNLYLSEAEKDPSFLNISFYIEKLSIDK